ncbi:hypothetical protein [Sphingomonas sp.]|uniref:hypothetical protein n=1 Tax=Sphingomonas sp. TaxID=28214 RepID=UPI003F6F02A8
MASDETISPQQKAIEASADAYAHLVRATSDICSPRYHYYCVDEFAKLPDELVLVANTRQIPIKDNALLQLGSVDGALEAEAVPDRGPNAVRFTPVKSRGKNSALTRWKSGLYEDFQQIETLEPRANYVCMPEFGFPFGLSYKAAIELPIKVDVEWQWLQTSEFLSERFVCLGSAHRSFYRTSKTKELQYENIAVIYPSGTRSSLDAKKIFEGKRDRVMVNARVTGVEFTATTGSERGITATFKEHRVSATRRAHLSQPGAAALPKEQVRFAKNAFDFYEMTADQIQPPIYVRKKSPARKLGEYIDASGKIELDVFVTDLGVVGVLICYDAFDPSIFLSAVRMYYDSLDAGADFYHQGIDVFFIPAFNRSPKFVEMCKVLSRETNSVVVYVSGDKRCEVKSNVFVCGHSCEVWAYDMTEGDPEGDVYSLTKMPGHEHLHVYRIKKAVISYAMRCLRTHVGPEIRKDQIMMSRRLGWDVLN